MRKTNNHKINDTSLCVSRQQLSEMLNCGISTSDRISREAEARVKVGKRVLICVSKVNSYLEKIAK